MTTSHAARASGKFPQLPGNRNQRRNMAEQAELYDTDKQIISVFRPDIVDVIMPSQIMLHLSHTLASLRGERHTCQPREKFSRDKH